MFPSDLERFLKEDIGEWDDSSALLHDRMAEAWIVSREECVISGLLEAAQIFEYLGLSSTALFEEGESVPAGAVVMTVTGNANQILQVERLALNFLGRMSGISTLTRKCVILAGGVCVAATRKTTPGFRYFEKRAVMIGGGDPHRFNLSGSVMIKDNHIMLIGLEAAIEAARRRASFTKKIEVEVETADQMLQAAALGADIIMFDNMKPSEIRSAVDLLISRGMRSRLLLEASGGITPDNIADYASTGIDVISLGILTRDARWIDFSLEIDLPQKV